MYIIIPRMTKYAILNIVSCCLQYAINIFAPFVCYSLMLERKLAVEPDCNLSRWMVYILMEACVQVLCNNADRDWGVLAGWGDVWEGGWEMWEGGESMMSPGECQL